MFYILKSEGFRTEIRPKSTRSAWSWLVLLARNSDF